MIFKFKEFILEAKGKNKEELINLIFKFLEQKPKIEKSVNYPSEKGAYSLSSVKKYFRENGFTSDDADAAFYYIDNDKTKKDKLKSFNAKNFHYDQSVPYYYTDLTETEVKKLKEQLEEESKQLSKPEIEKREASKKRLVNSAKEKEAKKAERKKSPPSTERKNPAKKSTTRKTTK